MPVVELAVRATEAAVVVEPGEVLANASALVATAVLLGPVPLAVASRASELALIEHPLGAVSVTV